jgi:hypothetical protein
VQERSVFLDVYPWIKASNCQGKLASGGIFRHAARLAELFVPAIALNDHEPEPYLAHLPFKVTIVREYETFPNLWLSLGVDQCYPESFIWHDPNIVKATIVHDALPLKGYYGEGNKQLFKFGIENNDVLLPVSKDALRQCGKLRNCKEIIPYSCFYDPIFRPPALPISLRLGIVTPVEDKRAFNSLSVFTLFDYKNLDEVYSYSRFFATNHFHIGAEADLISSAQVRNLHAAGKLNWLGSCSDEGLISRLWETKLLIQLSDDEGFSMPPMEAMLCGVPHILLSDIPVHREIYGCYNISFVPPNSYPVRPVVSDLLKVSQADVEDVKKRFTFDRAIKPFLKYAASL